ncbi:MAG: hypothetical protein MK052_10865, partial [Alphaproteobacteria bacterium]|nr:hypothetical protein [Alphaproteobacteria bacterium]
MLVTIFWIFFFLFLTAISTFIIRRYETKSTSDFMMKFAFLGVILLIGGMSMVGMFRYYHNLPVGFELREDAPLSQKLEVATSTEITPELAQQLSKDSNREVRYELAANFYIDVTAIANLLEDPNVAVRKRMARNLSVPIEMLESRLHSEKDPSVIATIQESIRFRKSRLAGTGQSIPVDPNPRLRITEALELLDEGSEDYRKIRLAIGSRPFLYSVDSLASDKNPDVRYAAASNINVSNTVLKELLRDVDAGVRTMASITLGRKENTEGELLESLSMKNNSFIREAVAS